MVWQTKMKALIQRVSLASVSVDGKVVGQIQQGVLAYIGIGKTDTQDTAKKLVDKLLGYRIFENTTDQDKLGKIDKSLTDVGGGLLLVSQFTLMADTNKGRRPDFGGAMSPSLANELFGQLVAYAKTRHHTVQTGVFGATMQVMAINEGPMNFVLEVHSP